MLAGAIQNLRNRRAGEGRTRGSMPVTSSLSFVRSWTSFLTAQHVQRRAVNSTTKISKQPFSTIVRSSQVSGVTRHCGMVLRKKLSEDTQMVSSTTMDIMKAKYEDSGWSNVK